MAEMYWLSCAAMLMSLRPAGSLEKNIWVTAGASLSTGNERLPRCTLAEAGIIAVLVGGVVLRYGSQDELELRVCRERIALVVGEAPG